MPNISSHCWKDTSSQPLLCNKSSPKYSADFNSKHVFCSWASKRLIGKESACQCRRWGSTGSRIYPGGERTTNSSTLTWKTHGQKSLVGYTTCDHKKSDVIEPITHTLLLERVQVSCLTFLLWLSLTDFSCVCGQLVSWQVA